MFHDAPVTRFLLQGDVLTVETEEFAFSSTEIVPPARIVISGLRVILRNEVEIPAFVIESDEAEIYGLDDDSGGVRLEMFWHFRVPRRLEVWGSYRFPGTTLRVEALVGGPLRPAPIPARDG